MKVAVIAIGIFGTGFASGWFVHRKLLILRLKEVSPLLTSTLVDIVDMANSEFYTEDEVREYAKEQLDFFKIVMG